jgi:hypothetical protein
MSKPTKRIRIPYSGTIYAKSGVYGPITTPYREDLDVIQAILVSGIPVIEVIDGREIPLTLSNYKKDFTKKEQVKTDPTVVVPVPSEFTVPPTGNPELPIGNPEPPAVVTPVKDDTDPTGGSNKNQQAQNNKNKEKNSQKQTNVAPDKVVEK